MNCWIINIGAGEVKVTVDGKNDSVTMVDNDFHDCALMIHLQLNVELATVMIANC